MFFNYHKVDVIFFWGGGGGGGGGGGRLTNLTMFMSNYNPLTNNINNLDQTDDRLTFDV